MRALVLVVRASAHPSPAKRTLGLQAMPRDMALSLGREKPHGHRAQQGSYVSAPRLAGRVLRAHEPQSLADRSRKPETRNPVALTLRHVHNLRAQHLCTARAAPRTSGKCHPEGRKRAKNGPH